jgi:hypothetical protein
MTVHPNIADEPSDEGTLVDELDLSVEGEAVATVVDGLSAEGAAILAEEEPLVAELERAADDAAFYDVDDGVPDEARFRKIYDVQHWRDTTARYLDDTVDGYDPAQPPLTQEQFRELPSPVYHAVVGAMAGGLAGEHIAFECSAALCSYAPDEHARMFLATQVIDEARHVEVFTKRLHALGKHDIQDTLHKYVNQRMFDFHDQMRERVVDARDFIGGVVGQNLALEGLALGFFEFNAGLLKDVDPGTAKILEGVLLDERRHVGFGLVRLRELCEKDSKHKAYVHDTVAELSEEMMNIFEENADDMARLGIDPTEPMDKVKRYHDHHLRRLGMALDA